MGNDSTIRDVQRELGRVTDDSAEGADGALRTPENIRVMWRDADPEARPTGREWRVDDEGTATLSYDAWSAQREVLSLLDGGTEDADADLIAFLAGYGSGKSIAGARWLITCALAYPSSQFLALGVDFAKARDSTFRVLFEQLPGPRTATVTSSFNGPETSPIVADYNRAEHRLTLQNDTSIKLGSADKWSRYAGSEFGGVWADEPSHYQVDLHDLLEMLGSRLRGAAGPHLQFWTLTGNGYNQAYDVLAQREDKNGESLGLDIELIRASTLDNPYLDDASIERFKRQYAGTSREEQALHGGFAAAQGLVYSVFSRDTHVIEAQRAESLVAESDDPEWRLYGYDAGWGDPRVVLEFGRTAYDQLVALDEFYESETHAEDAIKWLESQRKPKGVIYCDHHPTDINRFERAGWDARRADKSVDEGISEVRRRMREDDGRAGLLVSERCENLVRELLSYKEEHVKTASAVDHACDAMRYALHTDASEGVEPADDEAFIITSTSNTSSSGRSGW